MKKSTMGLLAAILIIVGTITFSAFTQQGEVTAAASAMSTKGWSKDFTKTVKIGDLFVTNDQGKRMTAEITLSNKGKTAHIKGIAAGSYTLHVKPRVVDGKRYGAHTFKFTMDEVLPKVATEKELVAYFKRVKKQQAIYFSAPSEEVKEESAMADSASDKSAGSSDYSTTNNQVDGVDEADMVKTDGNYIYAVGDGKVSITDIRDSKNIQKAAVIKTEEGFYPSQLFLHGKTLVVLGEKHEPYREEKQAASSDRIMPVNSMTTVRLYDVSNPKSPSLLREIGAEGYLNGARKSGDMLYFVTNVHPYFWMMDHFDGDVLRPSMYDSKESSDTQLVDYKNITILPGATEPSYSVITAINLASPATNKVVTKGYLGSSEQLYMSKDNLYLTATTYEQQSASNAGTSDMTMMWNPGAANTELFKFTLKGTDVTFHSSAELKGRLLNQFSMDEHKGNFRVVMTEGTTWDDKKTSENHLFILDKNMKLMGSVKGLAKGERIYSARFMGDKAYMVTFRETDPLFVIDVANPKAPKVLGELKIPGFSNYLHPLDDNHLIGFGYETVAEKNPNGGEPFILTMGMKISLFDISDFANPKEQDTEIIGGRGTYSPIQYDHKALFQHKDRNLYGFPVMVYDEMDKKDYIELQSSGALVYEITPEKGIVLKGDLLTKNTHGEQYTEWDNQIQRMLYSKDDLYTISMKEIKNFNLDTFAPISSVKLD